MFAFDGAEFLGHIIKGFVPGGLLELSVTTDQGLGQPVGMADIIVAEAALDAQTAEIGGGWLPCAGCLP